MTGIIETKELFLAAASLIKGWIKAKEDNGKVSIAEAVSLIVSNTPGVIAAARGAGEILEEAKDFTAEELDELYFSFLAEMEWEPTDNNRDIAAAAFGLFKDIYTNTLRLMNTLRPPQAEIV